MLNLGSPDSTEVSDVRRYLREFLSDGRVIYCNPVIRWFILNFAILPRRPKSSAEAYEQIWTKEGSPLLLTCKELSDKLADGLDVPMELGMRYGNPSTTSAVKKLIDAGVDDIFVMPLYPHYAMSSYETAIVKAKEAVDALAPNANMTVLPPFYAEKGYIDAMHAVAKPYLDKPFDRLQFSFHGIPEKHLRITDPTNVHCLECGNCCETASPAHATCYRHQCFQTVKAFVGAANLPESKYGVSFQSRLGRDPWLKPYTDFVLEELPDQGVKRLLVICPAFVADNLETLEEIAMQGRESFMSAGGESYDLIPCVNTHPLWVDFLNKSIQGWLS